MWTQRDQLQAYQFLRRRLVSALQVADANHPVSPSRRVIVCGAIGAVLMLLIAAGFGVYGLLRPGANSDWRKPGQVVIDKETGAPYVLLADKRLHPVVNYTSALLLAGGNSTARVSATSLHKAPRGRPVGIPGAPGAPPTATDLVTGPWTVCAQPQRDLPDAAVPLTVLTVGVRAAGAAVASTDALVVHHDDTSYVIMDGRHHRVAEDTALMALNLDSVTSLRVTQAWLSAIPAGPDLEFITVKGAGEQGPKVGDTTTRVGQILAVAHVGAAPRYYVVLRDGVAPVSETVASLILVNPRNADAYDGGTPDYIKVAASEIAASDQVSSPFPDWHPRRLPRAISVTGGRATICGVSSGGAGTKIRISPDVPLPPDGEAIGIEGDSGAAGTPGGADIRIADAVYLPPGRGALVIEQRASGATSGAMYLVTDQGIRYPLGKDARKALGYEKVRPTPVPATVLALLPFGPTLDRQAAARVVTAGSGGSSGRAPAPGQPG